jgi:phosphatidylinositol glycan class F
MALVDPVTMSSAGQASPPKASLPIELLPTGLAPIFAHIHPVLLLSAYYLRFPALVADPTTTLLNSLAPLAVVQMTYAVLCLPATGTSPRPAKRAKPGAKKTSGNDTSSTKPLVNLPPASPPFVYCLQGSLLLRLKLKLISIELTIS